MEAEDTDESPNPFTRKWTLFVILCMVPVFFLFAFLGYPEKGRAAAVCAGIVMFAIRASWGLRKYAWFWITIALVSAFHIPVVLFVPSRMWNFPGLTLLPVVVLDYAIVYGCIKLAEKVILRSDAASAPH